MRVGFIGAGKVGQSFGLYLHSKKVQISGYYSKTYDSAYHAASKVGSKAFENLRDVINESDIIALTVNDDQIENVVDQIVSMKLDTQDKVFFHMSGAHDSLYLKKMSRSTFSLHPLKAFPVVVDSPEVFKTLYFSLEGADASIKSWLSTLEINYFEIDSDQKAKYHAGAVIVSNYLVSVIDFGLKQFDDIGIDKNIALKAIWPLITDTIANIETMGTQNALTGPIVRGDIETVKRHLETLSEGSKSLYKALGKYTLSMTHHNEALQNQLGALFEEE